MGVSNWKSDDKSLHWSFNDNVMLSKTIFAKGFGAAKSTLPKDAFDPSVNWANSYDLVYIGPQGFTEPGKYIYGSLRLKTQFSGSSVKLNIRSIRQTGQNFAHEREFLSTAFECNRDDLFSLKKGSDWKITAETCNVKTPQVAPFRYYELKGSFKGGKILKQGKVGREYVYRQPDKALPVVSNWSILAAVQTLPRDRAFKFTYFEDLERLSNNHSIRFMGDFEATFGNRKVMLHGYSHKGAGIIPSFYWLDDSGRLLIARFGLSMLVYNEKPILESHPAKRWKGGIK